MMGWDDVQQFAADHLLCRGENRELEISDNLEMLSGPDDALTYSVRCPTCGASVTFTEPVRDVIEATEPDVDLYERNSAEWERRARADLMRRASGKGQVS